MTNQYAWYTLCLPLILATYATGEYIPPGPAYRCPTDRRLLYPCKCGGESDVGVAITCSNTNLASMSVAFNNLATFSLPIERLTISDCHIGRLYGSLFYKLRVRILEIIDTPLEVIDEHVFLGTNGTLNELYVLNSSLLRFPKEAIQILGNLTMLTLDNHNISSLPPAAFGDGDINGRLLRLHISNGNLTTFNFDSLHTLRRLRTLDLHGNQVKELKRNQFKGLRDVEVLDISHNNIAKVDSSHLVDLSKMGWCNVSHNELKELTRGAFARNAVLKWLDLSHNQIKRLDSNSFRGMRFMRRLYLSDNIITDVGRGTFDTMKRIGTIDLARNQLKKIDYQMFHELNYVEIVDVSANQVTEIQKLAFKDLFLTRINLSRNAISRVEAGAFVNCANMTVLDLSYNNITNLPKKTFDETTYPLELQLSHNFLTNLSQIPFQNMTGLKILTVTHNKLEKIPRFTFPKLYELHTIDLSHNNISDIFNSVFQPLFSLRLLNLSHNSLASIKPGTFGTLPTVLELDLNYNGLKDMAKSALTRLASLRQLHMKGNKLSSMFTLPISTSHLDLSYNEFEELPPKLWPSMNSLLSLDLAGNRLGDNIVKGSFLSLLTLQKLNLNYNGITRPPWESLSDLSSLQYLYMEGNNLTELRRSSFGSINVLFELHLTKNQIENVNIKAFEGLLQLLLLRLDHNHISYIPNGAFQGMVALRELDLSYNRIERLDNKTNSLLEECLSLEKLNLGHNRISFITRKTFPSNPYFSYKLREIDLSYNSMPVITYDLVYGTSTLLKLNLSNNAIADIRRSVIGNLTQLQVLDMSNNKLEDLISDREVFRIPANLSELYLAGNQLATLPWSHLTNTTGPTLQILDVSHNVFETFSPELTGLAVGNTSKVLFDGNPLKCDCFVRPLKRHFSGELIQPKEYTSIQCAQPPYLAGQFLSSVTEERLNCPSNVNTTRRIEAAAAATAAAKGGGFNPQQDYDVTPDLRYREVTRLKTGKLQLRWLVTRNEDIADTYVVIRDTVSQELAYEAVLPYFQRSAVIDLATTMFNTSTAANYQLCILAKDSNANVRFLYKSQCKVLGALLTNSAGKVTAGSVTIFFSVILSLAVRALLH